MTPVVDRRLAALTTIDAVIYHVEDDVRRDLRERGVRHWVSAKELHERTNARWWRRYRSLYPRGDGAAAFRYVMEASGVRA